MREVPSPHAADSDRGHPELLVGVIGTGRTGVFED
jgi:hypothetical protein